MDKTKICFKAIRTMYGGGAYLTLLMLSKKLAIF